MIGILGRIGRSRIGLGRWPVLLQSVSRNEFRNYHSAILCWDVGVLVHGQMRLTRKSSNLLSNLVFPPIRARASSYPKAERGKNPQGRISVSQPFREFERKTISPTFSVSSTDNEAFSTLNGIDVVTSEMTWSCRPFTSLRNRSVPTPAERPE